MELSVVCIHGENVLSVLKWKYTRLQSRLSISFIADKEDNGASIDKLPNNMRLEKMQQITIKFTDSNFVFTNFFICSFTSLFWEFST